MSKPKHKARNKKRTPKTSRGIHGATKHPLSEVEKVLLKKGIFRSLKPILMKAPWRTAVGFKEPFDAEQARINRAMYPHLFEGR